jgi:hypothetical protein
MAIAHKITENDVVALRREIRGWAAGTEGTAVSDHGVSKLIEVSDDRGQMLDLFEVAEEDLELIEHYPSKPAIPRTSIHDGPA